MEHQRTDDDSQAVRLARAIIAAGTIRDPRAEAEFYRMLAPRVRLYGLKHLRNRSLADDLVQDVLLMTLHRLRDGDIREPERVVSFVLGTCRQRVIDQKRNAGRRERILTRFSESIAAYETEAPLATDEDKLQRCLEHLPGRERAILLMTFYDDRPADEIGSALNLSPGNVRVIRHRGLERLRDCVENGGQVA